MICGLRLITMLPPEWMLVDELAKETLMTSVMDLSFAYKRLMNLFQKKFLGGITSN